ncbi:MAG: hypothetical protein ABI402_10060 [Ferruginibacter sp.]
MSNHNTWYKLIELLRKKDIIIDGLTIPFILGAQKYLDPGLVVNDDSIFNLLTGIVHSDTNEKAVLKDCAGNQYIIALRSIKFCKDNLSNARVFKNKKGNDSLYVSNDVEFPGKSLKEISTSLNEKYKGLFIKETFSWNDSKMSWNKLSEIEKKMITEAANT